MSAVTPAQQRTFDAIVSHTVRHGYAPTLRELAAEIGARSTNTVRQHLRALVRAGAIHVGAHGAARTIRVLS